jgi:hypothetical protein
MSLLRFEPGTSQIEVALLLESTCSALCKIMIEIFISGDHLQPWFLIFMISSHLTRYKICFMMLILSHLYLSFTLIFKHIPTYKIIKRKIHILTSTLIKELSYNCHLKSEDTKAGVQCFTIMNYKTKKTRFFDADTGSSTITKNVELNKAKLFTNNHTFHPQFHH